MRPRTLKRLAVAGVLAVSLAVIALGTVAWHQSRIAARLGPKQPDEELEQIVAEFRARKGRESWETAEQRLKGWMARRAVPGRTTEAEVLGWFKERPRDLDRPERDAVHTIEYELTHDGPPDVYVVIDFDSRTGTLQGWHTTESVCGWCPHILSHDGRWRLEGKMLAGRLGSDRDGLDTLLLPRLLPQDNRLRIRLANWAPELEYLDQVQLGSVPCEPDCEVDIGQGGEPYVWKEGRLLEIEPRRGEAVGDPPSLRLGEPGVGRVVVLEGRNTGEFETAMRKAVFTPGAKWPPAGLALHFDSGSSQVLQPVGTKFLRRVVVPVPPEARTVQLTAPSRIWLVRRAWLGRGQVAQNVTWLSASEASGLEVDVLGFLRDHDEHRLVLAPLQEVDLSFMAPAEVSGNLHHRFVLRLWGYYELLPSIGEHAR